VGPDTQKVFRKTILRRDVRGRDREDRHENAAQLFRHPIPEDRARFEIGVDDPSISRACCSPPSRVSGSVGKTFFATRGRSEALIPGRPRRSCATARDDSKARTAANARPAHGDCRSANRAGTRRTPARPGGVKMGEGAGGRGLGTRPTKGLKRRAPPNFLASFGGARESSPTAGSPPLVRLY